MAKSALSVCRQYLDYVVCCVLSILYFCASQIVCILQDLQALASACCKAAQVLHRANLVHRELRLPNVVQLDHQQYLVIDLESVAELTQTPLPADFDHVLKTCSAETLDISCCSTALSDMYCIALVVQEASLAACSVQAFNCISELYNKALTAEVALKTCKMCGICDCPCSCRL